MKNEVVVFGRRRMWRCLSRLALMLPLLAAAVSGFAQVVISEIHYHPVEEPVFNADGTPFLYLTNDVHEFVEIQNAGVTNVDLSGWSLSGGISYTFPTNTSVASGAFRVIARNPQRIAAVYSLAAADILGPYSGVLKNSGDTVRLRNAKGNTVDVVNYSSSFPWAQSADALGAQDKFTGLSSTNYQYKGRSLQRVSVNWPSSDPANWLASPLTGPTPGLAQAVTRAVPKPVVVAKSAVQTSDGAAIIRSNNAVTVNCTFSSSTNLSSVTLEYFVDNMESTTETRTSVVMTDLGGGEFTGAIPGQTNRSLVRYRFKANRGDGLEVVSPRADDPQIAPVGTNGTREAWWGYYVTPVRTTTNSAIYDVMVSAASLSTMSVNITQPPRRVTASSATGLPRAVPYVDASAPQWDGTVPGVLACNGEVWDIRIRYHGSMNHRTPTYYSYKIHLPDHQPLKGQTSWFETLHGSEFIEAQKLNRLLGLPASRMQLVDWYYNATTNYVHTEQGEYAGEMLDAYHELQQQLNPGSPGEDSGELYKNVGNRGGSYVSQNSLEGPYTFGDEAPLAANAGWTQLQRYEWTFSLQNHSWRGSKPIRDLIESMWTARGDSPSTHNFSSYSTNLASARAWFTNNWDIDTTLTSMALLEWMAIWDDAAQNHFFWRRANGKWSRLGWDYDNVMSTSGTGGGPGGVGGPGGTTNQTIYGGEYGATTVFDGVNWWKDTFYKCFRTEYNQRLWELNNSFLDTTNLTALGLTKAAAFAKVRRYYVNSQLSSLGTYYKPARPSNTWPASGAIVIGATNLITSAYAHSQSTAHAATKWEIRTASGDFEEPLLCIISTNNKTSFPIPFDQLTYGQTYYWRATHIDANGHPSVISAETSFSWGTASVTAGAVVLNEILADNHVTIKNGDRHPDYIELRNNVSTNIVLTGYSLSDDAMNPSKYLFPAGTTIAAGGYLIIWCDSEYAAPGLHAGFALNSAGQTVLLMNNGAIVDSVTFGPQAPDVSIGRILNGTGGWQANTPTPLAANTTKTLGNVMNLCINEWMADPAYGDDWFELFNNDSNVVALAGLYLSDTPATPMITQIPPLSFIAGRGFIKFLANGSSSGANHCDFKLSRSGESIVLTAANGATTIDTITFGVQVTDVSQGRLPDGSANVVSFQGQTASPGLPNWILSGVVINELLANPVSPLEDAVELYNISTNAAAIGGWWLSNDLLNPKKYQVPSGTILPAGSYKVVFASDMNTGSVPFALDPQGGDCMLSAVDASGNLTGYGSRVSFGPSATNVSFGRIQATGLKATSGGAEFWPMKHTTFGQDGASSSLVFRSGTGVSNSAPKIGPVAITEIMYHPVDFTNNVDNARDEFIELHNTTAATVDMGGWRLKGDVDFAFPAGTAMPAGSYLLLVSFNPTNTEMLAGFRTNYGLPADVPIMGPYSDHLANSTFDLELAYPAVINGYTNYINVDKVEYRDSSPWPKVDGNGKSLQRASENVIGNSAANWNSYRPTPGAVNSGAISALVIVNTSPLADGTVGVGYTNIFACYGNADTCSWSVVDGSLPDGLSFSSNGILSGKPTNAGTYGFTVQVTDNINAPVKGLFAMAIQSTLTTVRVQGFTNGSLQLVVPASVGSSFTIETSTNLVNWTILFTTNSVALPFQWTDPSTSNRVSRFYRVVQ